MSELGIPMRVADEHLPRVALRLGRCGPDFNDVPCKMHRVLLRALAFQRGAQIRKLLSTLAVVQQQSDLLRFGHTRGEVLIHVPKVVGAERAEFVVAVGACQVLADFGDGDRHGPVSSRYNDQVRSGSFTLAVYHFSIPAATAEFALCRRNRSCYTCLRSKVWSEASVTTTAIREQLRRQIDSLPDDLLAEIADFAAFILARRQGTSTYADWSESEWHKFSLGQFLREADDVEYTLADAEEVYRR